MKTFVNLKSIAVLTVMMVFGLTLNAQRQYKHPRVKVKAETQTQVKVKENKVTKPVVTPVTETVINNETAEQEITITVESGITASSEGTTTTKQTHKPLVKQQLKEEKKAHTRAELVKFTQKLMKHTNLMKIQDIQKTQMETWLLIMIILLAAGFLFMILAIIFAFATYIWGLALVFWILFGLCWTAAIVVLILGVTGVI